MQVVGLVLQHAGEQAFALQHEGFAVAVHAGHARPVLARGRGLLAGHGQAAFAAFLVFFADFEHGVDDVALTVVNATEGENLLGDADLRSGEPHAAHVVHGFQHVVDESRQVVVEDGDGFADAAQHRVAHGADAQDGHSSPLPAPGRSNVLTDIRWGAAGCGSPPLSPNRGG